MTLSALVQKATLPGEPKRSSLAANSSLPSKRDREPITSRAQGQRVPLVGGHLDVRPGELLSLAVDHPIEAHVVLERVRAHDVVVVAVQEADGDAPSLIDFPGNRPEAGRSPPRPPGTVGM